MRKIYSIVLTACALLLSTSLFAVDVTTRQQIQDAINGGIGSDDPVNIVLKAEINVDVVITIQDGQTVNIDLNGFNMTAGNPTVFTLKKGTLNLTGTGTIDKSGKGSGTGQTDAIRVLGSIVPEDANYSNLTIGENVTVKSHGPQSAGKETTNAITVIEQGTSSAEMKAAYGVNIEIKGIVYGTKYGVKINGNVKGDGANVPYVHVASTAEVYCAPNSDNSTAIYSSGNGKFDIYGYVHGATGICVKGGIVNVTDAIVKSDYSGAYQDPEARRKGNGTAIVSGFEAGGSAIVIASQTGYPGNQEVTINGDTKVIGGSGYAIDEALLVGGTEVKTVEITGGTIEAGGQGAIIITKETASGDNTVQIAGGNIENEVYIREEGGTDVTSAEVGVFTPTGNYSTTEVNDPTTGKTTIVVTKLEDGVNIDETGKTIVQAADAGEGLKWTGVSENIEANTTLPYLEINANKAQVVTVKDGYTLTIGRVVMGTQAQIIVKAGARLVITGEQGIVAPVTSNIVLETSESNPAIFLFNPAVTSNRHPNATVSLIANSYTNPDDKENDYLYQRFGVPTHNAIKKVTAKKGGEDVQMFVRKYEKNGWTNVGYLNVSGKSLNLSQLNDPFGYYILQCNTAEVGTLVNMEGELVGNDNATLRMGQNTNGWSTFANSYSADLDMTAMLDMFKGMPAGTNIAVYYQKNETGTDNQLGWDTWNFTTMLFKTALTLHPMQAFLMQDPAGAAAESLALNYKNMVYDPAMADAEAPAPRRAMSNLTMASVNVMNNGDAVYMIQGDEFSSEMESGYDSEKYMSGNANIYVMSDKKYATCATDNLENTYLGFSCAEAGNYTISFEHIAGEGLALVDMVANKVINMTEGATYEFYAQESNDYRFKVVGRNNVATDVETVENAVKAAGVYTLTGMYLGNMSVWNTLPAGVYVVDGEKRVK